MSKFKFRIHTSPYVDIVVEAEGYPDAYNMVSSMYQGVSISYLGSP